MKKFINLLSDELHRARWFYGSVLGLVVVSQLVNFAYVIMEYKRVPDRQYGLHLSSFFDGSQVYSLLVFAAVLILIIYCVYTWLREWNGGSNFMTRLLLLPGNRFSIVLAKLASVLLMTGGVLFVQLLMIWLIDYLAPLFIGTNNYLAVPWVEAFVSELGMTSQFLPFSWASAAIFYSFFVWLLLGVFVTMLSYLMGASESRLKGFNQAFNAFVLNIVGLIVGIMAISLLLLTATERFILLALILVAAISLNLYALYRKINIGPRQQVKLKDPKEVAA